MGPTGRHVFGAERRQPSHHLLQESHRSGRQVRQVPLATLQPPGTGVGEDQGTARLQEAAQRPGPRPGKCMNELETIGIFLGKMLNYSSPWI